MEEKVIYHFCHEHPLILTENVGNYKETLYCYGCHKPVNSESAYVCGQQYCSNTTIFHKRCAEMPRQISHPSHPQHPLHLFRYPTSKYRCNICCCRIQRDQLGYRCRRCDFDIDISCPHLGIELFEQKRLQHPSHHHPLTLMRKPASLFYCDVCGTQDWDMAYVCSTCEFWVHKTCASLPIPFPTNRHKHPLSLAFCFPFEYRNFEYDCDVCHKEFHIIDWVYYCGDCRYFVHVKCAASSETTKEIIPAESNLNTEENDGSLIQFPINDFSKELITPFIMRQNGFDKIPADVNLLPASVSMPETTARFSLSFHYHKHPLSLVSEEPAADQLMMMICDVCVTPIYSPPYYNCATCKYFVHSTCYLLSKTLSCPDSQLYGGDGLPTCENHKLIACKSPKLDYYYGIFSCRICELFTNGMVYECEDCKLRIDVKCASLPATIKHAAHQQHKLMRRRTSEEEFYERLCDGCGYRFDENEIFIYCCTSDGCDFGLHLRCVLLPQTIKNEWDKHPLLLTYDASIDHPSDFYCEICEKEMHPKKWMYHCRKCDHSFHIHCLTATGKFRNIKFGRQFEFSDRIHPHPLTYNQITLKLSCDTCYNGVYRFRGYECASCNFVMCQHCGLRELRKMYFS